MSKTTKKRRDSILLPNIITKMEEEGCEYITRQESYQTSSPYERCEDGTYSAYKSHSVLTFATCPLNSMQSKRIKLNESLSYRMIPINHQIKYISPPPQNNSSSTLLSSGIIQRGTSSYIASSTLDTMKDSGRNFNDYESYIHSFPDYRLGRVCGYKIRRNVNQHYHQGTSRHNSSQQYPHPIAQTLDYQNLVLLFTNQHFSVQVADCADLQTKCMNFIRNYSVKSFGPTELTTFSALSPQGYSNSQSFYHLNSQNSKKGTNNSNMNQNANDSNLSQMQKQHQRYGQNISGKLDLQAQLDNSKTIKLNLGYQLLLKNIQYGIIKEITGIQKIEFSQRTISKVISKFILFLKGDYRSLKYYDLDHKFEKETAAQISNKHSSFSKSHIYSEGGTISSQQPFEIPTLDLFELLDEQDRKEFVTTTQQPKSNPTSKKNSRNSQTSTSSQPPFEKAVSQQEQELPLDQEKRPNHQLDLSSTIDQSIAKVKLESQIEAGQINYFLSSDRRKEEYVECSISPSPTVRDGTKIEQSFLNKSDSINCGESEQTSNATSKNQMKQKQTLFNLSKYLMHLILEFLNEDHLDGLDIIPGFLPLVQQVIRKIKKKGQRTEHSQTYYYNHSHYNCLFLLLNVNNIDQIQKSDELHSLHQFVFEIQDFLSPFFLTQINIIKSIIAKLIIKQFKIIRSMINAHISTNPIKYSNYKNYMITKLQYFERVFQGIQNLKKGSFLVRF